MTSSPPSTSSTPIPLPPPPHPLSKYRLLWLLLAFIVGLLPYTSSLFVHYPDERHYTDAAIQMLHTSDWLTPRWGDNHQPRLLKPVLTYWLVAIPFRYLGVGVWQSRILFLLLACATLTLTYHLAKRIFQSKLTAWIACLILFSHPQFCFAAIRCIPDMPLIFAMLLSAWGLFDLLLPNHRRPWSPYLFYLGIGLAISIKGLLPLAWLAYALLFSLLFARKNIRLLSLFNPPAILLGIALASWWYITMHHLYGSQPLNQFALDQIQRKTTPHWTGPLWAIPTMLAILLFNFLPWSLISAEAALKQKNLTPTSSTTDTALPPNQRSLLQKFVFGWAALLCLIFGLGINPSVRYLLPVSPLLAIILADILAQAHPSLLRQPFRGWTSFLFLLLLLTSLCLAAINLQLQPNDWNWPLTLIIFASLSIISLRNAFKHRRLQAHTTLALTLFAFLPILFLSLSGIFLPDTASKLAAVLQHQLQASPITSSTNEKNQPILYIGPPSIQARFSLITQGRYPLHWSESNRPTAPSTPLNQSDIDQASLCLISENQLSRFDFSGFQFQRVPAGFQSLPPKDFLLALLHNHLAPWLDSRQQYFLIGSRPSCPQPPSPPSSQP